MEKELFEIALSITEPIYIEDLKFNPDTGALHIHMNFHRGATFACSECGKDNLSVKNTIKKSWRHLNFFQHKCYLHLRTPSTICPDCGVRLWIPPWGRKKSGFTLLFEAFILTLAKGMPVSQISKLVAEHDTRLWRIIRHHVNKAYSRKVMTNVTKVGTDETSRRRGHNYVTVFANLEKGDTLFVTKGRDSSTIKAFADELGKHGGTPDQIKEVAIDMSTSFISGVEKYLTKAKITFDKFHIIKALNEALDEVRREEQKLLPFLKKTRYIWLKNPKNLTKEQTVRLRDLRGYNLKTGKVYQMKLNFQEIFRNIEEPEIAETSIKKWLSWAVRSRIEPVKNFARMVKEHWCGIMHYFTSRLTSGIMEGLNSRIQEIKRRARGFRNVDNFITLIYLETASLDFSIP